MKSSAVINCIKTHIAQNRGIPAAARAGGAVIALQGSATDGGQHLGLTGLQVFAQASQRFVARKALHNVQSVACCHGLLRSSTSEAVQTHALQAQGGAGFAKRLISGLPALAAGGAVIGGE